MKPELNCKFRIKSKSGGNEKLP